MRSRHPLYRRWILIRRRCHGIGGQGTPNDYKRYEARGISVQESWRFDFEAFKDYCYSLEPNVDELLTLKYHLDRKDNNGDYEEGNLRWITPKENSNNKSNNVRHFISDRLLTVSQAIEEFGSAVPAGTVRSRIQNGMSLKEAITIEGRRPQLLGKLGRLSLTPLDLYRNFNPLNLKFDTIRNRLRSGWAADKALLTSYEEAARQGNRGKRKVAC